MTLKMNTHRHQPWGDQVAYKERIEVRDPQNDELIDTVAAHTAEDMEHAIRRAHKAAQVAEDMPVHERMRILNKAADLVEEQQEQFAQMIATEGSKTIREARSEVSRCQQTLRLSAEEARRIHGETIPSIDRWGTGWSLLSTHSINKCSCYMHAG